MDKIALQKILLSVISGLLKKVLEELSFWCGFEGRNFFNELSKLLLKLKLCTEMHFNLFKSNTMTKL